MQVQTRGIIIRETPVGENDKYVTLLTENLGTVEAYVRGARRKGSRLATSTGLFCYASFELFRGKSGYYIDQADVIALFYDLRLDLVRLSTASYFCQVLCELGPDGQQADETLRLTLRALHLLSRGKKDFRLVKAVFELRALSIGGLCPDLVACRVCAQFDKPMRFYIGDGEWLCGDCAGKASESGNETGFAELTPGVLAALRHIVYSPIEKAFSFTLDDENMRLLAEVCESYLLYHTERNYRSLDFLKTVTE